MAAAASWLAAAAQKLLLPPPLLLRASRPLALLTLLALQQQQLLPAALVHLLARIGRLSVRYKQQAVWRATAAARCMLASRSRLMMPEVCGGAASRFL